MCSSVLGSGGFASARTSTTTRLMWIVSWTCSGGQWQRRHFGRYVPRKMAGERRELKVR